MNRPMTYSPTLMPSYFSRRMLLAIGAVLLIHVALFYAFTSGLAGRVIHALPQIIQAEIVKPPPEKQHPTPLPPPKPQLAEPAMPTVPPPQINIRVPPPPRAITQVQRKIVAPKPVVTHPAQPAPAPAPVVKPAAIAPTSARAIEATHTIPPYPPVARRLGQEGTVLLALDIGPDGRVHNAAVLNSSGHNRLDDAAIAWVRAHWRYHPATRDGHPVAAHTTVRIVFNLSSGV